MIAPVTEDQLSHVEPEIFITRIETYSYRIEN